MSQERARQYRSGSYDDDEPRKTSSERTAPKNGTGTSDQQGWDAYRKWLSQVSARPERRTPLDHSIYSWKGYHNWADRVRQSWKPEET